MSNPVSSRRLHAMLTDFRQHVAAIVEREEQLRVESGRRRTLLKRHAEQLQSRQEVEASQRRVELEEIHRRAFADLARRYQARKERIHRAQIECRRAVTQRMDRLDGREVFSFQKGTLDSEKLRASGLLAAQEAHADITNQIAQEGGRWLECQKVLISGLGTFGRFRRLFSSEHPGTPPDLIPDAATSLELARTAISEAEADGRQALGSSSVQVFKRLPIWLVIALLVAGVTGGVLFPNLHGVRLGNDLFWVVGGGFLFSLFLIIRHRVQSVRRAVAERCARRLSDARHWLASATTKAEEWNRLELARIERDFAETNRRIREQWSAHQDTIPGLRAAALESVVQKTRRVTRRNEERHDGLLKRLEGQKRDEKQALEEQISRERAQATSDAQADAEQYEQQFGEQWNTLTRDWQSGSEACLQLFHAAASPDFDPTVEWNSELWRHWEPPTNGGGAVRIGKLQVDIVGLVQKWPTGPALRFEGSQHVELPLWLAYPEDGALVVETHQSGNAEAEAVLSTVAYRLLCQFPPGRLQLTILDPVGLGKAFSSLLSLADYAGASNGTGQRIWTESAAIEERLAELTEHLEKIIQMYLRSEFANLMEYNARAGSIAERHHLLIVAGFPVNFSDNAARRLLNIITNGRRCGIITLVHWDRRHLAPPSFLAQELPAVGVHLVRNTSGFSTVPALGDGVRLAIDPPPPTGLAQELLRRIGQGSRDANKVEVPFTIVAPGNEGLWQESTLEEIRVPIGRTGATKLQYLTLGHGTRQHALISGKTGSGKSNLLHVLVTNLALRCSPAEIEFYLVDFKKGVEFKAYATARLPHARVVAIESDREFGLSVLERLDEELRRRGELFRQLGVQNLPGYRQGGGREPMPRCLLLVDEFQEYFVQEDRISQNAAALLDRIVRQGRAFGIHVILASQTLGGTYALARATLGQMAVRIAFHCDEADAFLIMGDDNPAPRLLSRPGEGIYNDGAGAVESNSPFQAVWLPDEVRLGELAAIRERTAQSPWQDRLPVVFEGSAPAEIGENGELKGWLLQTVNQPPVAPVAWLGAPNSIKGPTAVPFTRSGGSNLLVVGARDESALSLTLSALVSLAAQHPPQLARFVVVDATPSGTDRNDLLGCLAAILPQSLRRATPGELPAILSELTNEISERQSHENTGKPGIFLFLLGLQQCKKLKPDDSFGFSLEPGDGSVSPSVAFQKVYVEGPSDGIHTIAFVDSYNNVTRYLGRKGLSEFDLRVLFQMSASDSSSLMDQPAAANLGLYGALYYNEREGRTETFRPYALPGTGWLASVLPGLRGLRFGQPQGRTAA